MSLNLKKHWEKQSSTDRHIVTKNSDRKWHKRLIYNLNTYTLKYISLPQTKTVLDWGCGGGLLAKELKQYFHTSVVDISENSLENCIKYADPNYSQLISPDIDTFNWRGGGIDFIHCHALVWHFPTFEYFENILNIWVNLSPKYIAFNTKPSESNYIETKNYQKDFLSALKLNDNFVIKLLNNKNYKLVNKELVTTGKTPQTYFVFEKR